jgi:Tfp pilus assembly protein PilP
MRNIMRSLVVFILSLSAGALAAPVDSVTNFFRDKTQIDKPFKLRDPFKAPQGKTEKGKQMEGYYISSKGQYSNIKVEKITSIENLRVVGVLIGKERRAMVRSGDSGNVVIIKEGMKIGEDEVELKAILPGGIILVEKIVNVYGQEEYLETVIPISR